MKKLYIASILDRVDGEGVKASQHGVFDDLELAKQSLSQGHGDLEFIEVDMIHVAIDAPMTYHVAERSRIHRAIKDSLWFIIDPVELNEWRL